MKVLPNKKLRSSRTDRLIKQAISIIVLITSFTTHAIVMRHDVEPNEYLLDTLDYQSTLAINGCTATLIAPSWILTAAHCTYPNLHDGITIGSEINFIDEVIAVKSIYNHPDFTQGDTRKHDIALVELVVPSFSVLPTPIYEKNDELGKVMKLTGFGVVGDGERDIYDYCFPCALRGADNKVEEVNDYHLRFKFDHPDDGNSLALEGVGAGGDSGGPVYIETENGRYVAGVSSFGSRKYNNFDNYVRVSKELGWIYEVMGADYMGNYTGPLYSEQNRTQETQSKESNGGSFTSVTILALFLLILFRNKALSFWLSGLKPGKCINALFSSEVGNNSADAFN